MRALHMHLEHERFEDLLSFLVEVGLRAHPRYDPSYGLSETTYLYRRMRPRVVDWIRQELGDSRHGGGGKAAFRRELLSLDAIAGEHQQPGYWDPLPGPSEEDEWTEALERLGHGLSAGAQATLVEVARPLAEGMTAVAIAENGGPGTGTQHKRLQELRTELEAVGLSPGRAPA